MSETATHEAEQTSTTAQIKAILAGDDDNAGERASADAGDDVAQQDDGGADGRPGELDVSEPDPTEGMDDDTPESEDGNDDGLDEPVGLEDFAEQLELDKAELYEVQVPVGDGENISIGELKDAYKEYGPVKEAQQRVKETTDQYQRDLLSTRAQLNQMMQVANTPEKQMLLQEMMSHAGQMQSNYERQQQQAVFDSMPEWKDAATRIQEEQSIVELGSTYGFSEPEMTYTKDARTLRMLRDFAKARAELAEVRSSAKRVHAKPNAPGRKKTAQLTKRKLAQKFADAKASPHLSDKRGYVQDLLTG